MENEMPLPDDGCLHLLMRVETRRPLCLSRDQERCLESLVMAYLQGVQATYSQAPGARAFVERALRTTLEEAAWNLLTDGQRVRLAQTMPARASQPRLRAIA